MATTTTTTTGPGPEPAPPLRSELVEGVRTTSNARWGAIIGGAFMAVASWIVLHLLGLGVGLTVIDPNQTSSLRAIGLGTGIWSLIAPIIAVFIGGLVVSRLAPTPSRLTRVIHGGLVWAVTTLATITLLVALASSLVRGAVSTGGQVVSTAAGAVGGVAGAVDRDALSSLGIKSDDLLAPINQRLRAEGKSEVTAQQLEAALKDTLRTAVRTGNLDRQTLVNALATNTPLTPRDADQIANSVEARWQQVQQRGSELANRASTAALEAAQATGKALLGLAIALILGLVAAAGGSLLTGNIDRRRPRPASE
ncbi:MAG TPA: hypothetical protein VF516_03505 [Kofleriaceae bacterium]